MTTHAARRAAELIVQILDNIAAALLVDAALLAQPEEEVVLEAARLVVTVFST